MSKTDEIKEALEKAEETQAYFESKRTHKWLKYLLQENQRYRETFYAINEELCDDFSKTAQNINFLIYQALKKEGESD